MRCTMKTLGLVLLSLVATGLLASAASASPRYHAHYLVKPYAPYGYGYYDGYAPAPVSFVFPRHDPGCQYPNGWNVTDFSRDVNGIPRSGSELLATGCAAYVPIVP